MTDDRQLRLDDQLCFALYAAMNAVSRSYRPLLRELGITYSQYLTLMALWHHGAATVSEIAARVDQPVHAMGPLLRRLEDADLIVRQRDPHDRRAIRVALTAAGTALQTPAAAVQGQVVCASGLEPEDLANLRSDLHHLVDSLRASAADEHRREEEAS